MFFARVLLVQTWTVTEYAPAKTGEYPVICLKWYFPIFKPYLQCDEIFRLKFNLRLETVLLLFQKKEPIFFVPKSYLRTLKCEHLTQ